MNATACMELSKSCVLLWTWYRPDLLHQNIQMQHDLKAPYIMMYYVWRAYRWSHKQSESRLESKARLRVSSKGPLSGFETGDPRRRSGRPVSASWPSRSGRSFICASDWICWARGFSRGFWWGTIGNWILAGQDLTSSASSALFIVARSGLQIEAGCRIWTSLFCKAIDGQGEGSEFSRRHRLMSRVASSY